MYAATGMGQGRMGLEIYRYPGGDRVLPTLSSKVYCQDNTKWYAELRYNYEKEETFASSVGKTFLWEGDWSYAVTPVAGVSVGKLQGVSLGMNGRLLHRAFELTSSVQYGVCPGRREKNLFSWWELNWQLSEHMYMGCTVQQLCSFDTRNIWEPGVQMGVAFKGWSMPLYIFHPMDGGRFFVLGICREWKK